MNKKDLTTILLGMIFGLIAAIILNALVWWGIGNLVIYAFNLNYSWNFIHGLCVGLIHILLSPNKIKLNLDNLNEKEEEKDEEK